MQFAAQNFILLDDATNAGNSYLYQSLQHVDVINSAADLDNIDVLLVNGQKQSWHVVLFAPYEFAQNIAIKPSEIPFHDAALRLFWFEKRQNLTASAVNLWLEQQDLSQNPCGIGALQASLSQQEYCQAIEDIQRLIADGDTYQVNFTYRLHGKMFGDPLRLYRELKSLQPVPYGVLACLPNDEWVLSLSPELFIRHDAQGALLAQPMKGTALISGDADVDKQSAQALASDAKNRAENVMIVDLLRNDIGKIAQTGSVKVSELFAVAAFGRVLQMTSKVSGQMQSGLKYSALLPALFPCGSITGAPKQRTMQIIQQLEKSSRGLYCGAIGWIEPTPTKDQSNIGAFCFSVAIRTLVLSSRDANGWRKAELGIGSGIVADSIAKAEYLECAWKSRFLREHQPNFELFETMRIERGACALLAQHLQRLANSAEQLGFLFDAEAAKNLVMQTCAQLGAEQVWRLRLALAKTGKLSLQHSVLKPLLFNNLLKVCIAEQRLPLADPLRAYKISARSLYDKAWQQAESIGAFDALFFNAADELLEGGRSSVFIKLDGVWLTPKLEMGILPGIMRAQILQNSDYLDSPVIETIISKSMLAKAENIAICNALRGVLLVEMIADY